MGASMGVRRTLWFAGPAAAVLMASVTVSGPAVAASLALREPPMDTHVAVTPRLVALAKRGNAHAQAELGFAYEYGYGVPQDYAVAVLWYRRAAERGDATAQYLLALMYDRGQGVNEDTIAAQKWLIIAVANATRRQRDDYARIRDAVASKMTAEEIARAQALAYAWSRRPRR